MNTPKTQKIATACWQIMPADTFEIWADRLESALAHAAKQGAQLLVLPEYASLELAGACLEANLVQQLAFMADQERIFVQKIQDLAKKYALYLLAPSLPVRRNNAFLNCAYFCAPDGTILHQNKQMMTRFESEEWNISSPEKFNKNKYLNIIQTEFGKIAIAICYDVEFPFLVQNALQNGAKLILCPSCTDTAAGAMRIEVSARARALEGQCFVAVACTAGQSALAALDENTGCAAIYAPIDRGFPSDGILARGTGDEFGWVYADLDLALLDDTREHGQVRNFRDGFFV